MEETKRSLNDELNAFLDQRGRDALDREAQMRSLERRARKRGDEEAPQALPPSPKVVKPLEFYKASSLYGVHLDRPPLIVYNMIPAGLTVLAGAPKRGKSWLSLLMGICVAEGKDFLGLHTKQGDVLYLDLESRQYRIQDRMSRLIPGQGPDRLYISHESERVDSGLMQQIEGWIKTVEQPSMVIIDTLGRVKGGSRRMENAYDADTRILGDLQKFGMEHKIAIVCVHHLRKAGKGGDDGGDYFERVTGSMGITGACDAVILLDGKRDDPTSTLRVTGRDFEPSELVVRMERGAWRLESANSEAWETQQAFNRSSVVRGVLALMQTQERWEGTAGQLVDAISEATKEPIEAAGNRLTREINQHAEMLRETEGIRVYTKRKNTRRIIVIERETVEELAGF